MSTFVWVFAGVGLGSVFGGWGHYMATIPGDRVPRYPTVMFISQTVGLMCAGVALVMAGQTGSIPAGVMVMAGFAIFMGMFFFILYSLRKTPLGKIQVKVDAPMLAFEGVDSTGNSVNSDDWRGRRVLVKFFRGLW
ncbi:MAG: hypothetical protein ACI9ON_003269 [Limisphaerales bacterium]|jgi:hypothetical protein